MIMQSNTFTLLLVSGIMFPDSLHFHILFFLSFNSDFEVRPISLNVHDTVHFCKQHQALFSLASSP